MNNRPPRRPVVITRKHGERVILESRGTKIVVEVRRQEGRTRLAITAPAAYTIYREEVRHGNHENR